PSTAAATSPRTTGIGAFCVHVPAGVCDCATAPSGATISSAAKTSAKQNTEQRMSTSRNFPDPVNLGCVPGLIDGRRLAGEPKRRARDRDLTSSGQPHHVDRAGIFRRAGVIGGHGSDLRGPIPMPEGNIVGTSGLELIVADEPGRTQPVRSIR